MVPNHVSRPEARRSLGQLWTQIWTQLLAQLLALAFPLVLSLAVATAAEQANMKVVGVEAERAAVITEHAERFVDCGVASCATVKLVSPNSTATAAAMNFNRGVCMGSTPQKKW